MRAKVFFLSFLTISLVYSQVFWKRTEPYSGALNKMYFGGGDTIYGTQNSGFTRSIDNGTTWSTPVIVDYVTDMAVAPNGYIFLSENQKKISRSTNKGTSWTVVGNGITQTSCSSVIATASGALLVGTAAGIYRSTNNGDGWQKIAGGAQLGSDTTIGALATYDGKTVYAFTRVNSSFDYSYAVRSTDDGVTWTKSANKLDSVAVYKAIVHPNGSIYVRSGNGIRYSSDGGNSWSAIGFYQQYVNDLAYGPNGEIFAVVDNNNLNEIYKTTNNGVVWTKITTPFISGSSLAVNKSGNIFLGQDQMYRSTDGGTTWKGLPVSFPNVTLMTESPRHELFFTAGGSAYQKLYRSSDFGQTWNPMNTGVVGIPIVGFYADTLLVADNYYAAKIYRSIDNGKSFKPISGITVLSGYVNALLGTSYQSIIAGTSTGIFRSTNHGKDWLKVSNSPLSYLYQLSNGTMFGFRTFFGAGVFRSIDSGSTWVELKNGIGSTSIYSLAFAPNGNLFIGANGGAFRSTDDGDNWVRIDTQKVSKPYGIYIAVNTDGKLFFGGANSGINSNVYQSTNFGVTWNLISNNITTIDNQASLRSLFTSSNGDLFAGTSSGLFQSASKITNILDASTSVPESFTLYQNYPNPFNPSTTIRFTVRDAGIVSVTVYDLIGRKMKELVNSSMQPGSYSVTFDASKFSSGIYFYSLRSGTNILTKKMSLIR
ncbi:MAG: T9SS type A sorting domain-containing protein [Bacteroidota bacterium]